MQKGVLPKTSEAVFNRSSQNSRVKPSMKKMVVLFVNRILSGFLWGVCECGHPYFYA